MKRKSNLPLRLEERRYKGGDWRVGPQKVVLINCVGSNMPNSVLRQLYAVGILAYRLGTLVS